MLFLLILMRRRKTKEKWKGKERKGTERNKKKIPKQTKMSEKKTFSIINRHSQRFVPFL